MSNIDEQFVEYIVKSLVGKPEAVVIERRIDEKGVLLELTVDPEDLGRVIGKKGATAQSIRSLLRALGTKNGARYNLKIIDNGVEGGSRERNNSEERNNEPRKVEEEVVVEEAKPEVSDSLSKTRKELEDLDDLDI